VARGSVRSIESALTPEATTPRNVPRLTVVGLGPAGPEYLSEATRTALTGASRSFLRTREHPAAAEFPDTPSFDDLYDRATTFDEVYAGIVQRLVAATHEVAADGGAVVYAVPGSPLVAERTVDLLRAETSVTLSIVPALSFLDLCWQRLSIDPLASGVTIVDGARFDERANATGPFLVAQCWSRLILSDIKLTVDEELGDAAPLVTVLHHLGLNDERIETVSWWDLDRTVDADHLTSLWIPALADRATEPDKKPMVGGLSTETDRSDAATSQRLIGLTELVRTLRARCPWDMEQTHVSLSPHLLEESYEVIDAISDLEQGADGSEQQVEAYAHLCEELGDVLFQVFFHACLAEETGAFTMDDIVDQLHSKLVHRHPHVFGEKTVSNAQEVVNSWEAIKKDEKGRRSVTEGIPSALPSLALAAKLQRKALSVGLDLPEFDIGRDWLSSSVGSLVPPSSDNTGLVPDPADQPLGNNEATDEVLIGALLFGLADLSRRLGVDPEQALRQTALNFRDRIVATETSD
jgi:tetrapyrrole methylase family protein / MazG family protein